MKNATITILSIVTLAGLSGCDEVICTAEVSPSVLLSLVDELDAAIAGAEVSVTDGSITEDCFEQGHGLYSCGSELVGDLTISMSASGFEPEELDVYVDGGECGVFTEEITHAMTTLVCTLEVVPSVRVTVSDESGAAIADAEVSYAPLSEEVGAESIDCSGYDEVFYCGEDQPGSFNITAQAAAFLPSSAEVTVEMDEVGCHVVTESVDFVLAAE